MLQFAKTRDLAIGEIVGLHAREGLIDPDTFRINWDKYNPIGDEAPLSSRNTFGPALT